MLYYGLAKLRCFLGKTADIIEYLTVYSESVGARVAVQ